MSEEIKGKPILEVEHLKMYFPLSKGFMKKADGVVKAVDDISFSVERGKTLGIVGRAAEKQLPENVFYRSISQRKERSFIRGRI